MTIDATYSPDDNKLRLYASTRLDAETFARVKAAGFIWAPKQELFVAPAWTPSREDLALELAGDIGDEDTSLVDRAEARAERFDDYAERRAGEADAARAAVERISGGIPLGQPILVGHHSERHARKDAERIQNGTRRAVNLWETSRYWQARAAGAVRAAKYKERTDVRARRIKTIEADRRKSQRETDEAAHLLRVWSKVPRLEWDEQTAAATYIAGRTRGYDNLYSALVDGHMHGDTAWRRAVASCERVIAWHARWLAHYDNRLAYERAMLAEAGGLAADAFDLQPGGQVRTSYGWQVILRVTKAEGKAISVRVVGQGWTVGVEEIRDYRPPTEQATQAVAAATKLAPLCNYRAPGGLEMTGAEWKARTRGSDFWYVERVAATATVGAHRRRVRAGSFYSGGPAAAVVFITDAKEVQPPAPPADGVDPKAQARAALKAIAAPAADGPKAEADRSQQPEPVRDDAPFAAAREALRTGTSVAVAVAPQLFPTPPELAGRMVDRLRVPHGARVLEPSAGTGNLLAQLPGILPFPGQHRHTWCGDVVAVECSAQLAQGLTRAGLAHRVVTADFLALQPPELGGLFDAVVMNPPFANADDVKHITHALQFLKPGGRLVALCANGPRQQAALRSLVDERGGEWEDLPAGSFAAQGTGVNVAMLSLTA